MRAEIKFVILLLILTLLCLCGMCSCMPVDKAERVNYEIQKDMIGSMRVVKFEYEGHQYIMFGCSDDRSIVHDPNCRCKY